MSSGTRSLPTERKMKEVIRNTRFAVWDDVLSPSDFGNLMAFVSKEKFISPHKDGWESVWKASDGECMRTAPRYSDNFPTNTPLDAIFYAMQDVCVNNPEIAGKHTDIKYKYVTNKVEWNRLTISSYIYPAGVRLSWHGDGDVYTSALTYYCHPRWSPHWGGELLVANTPSSEFIPTLDYDVSPGVDHSRLDAWINAYGLGYMIVPKPNRLVLMRAGVCHMVNRVDQSAGDNLRMSVVGFTLTNPKEQCGTSQIPEQIILNAA